MAIDRAVLTEELELEKLNKELKKRADELDQLTRGED